VRYVAALVIALVLLVSCQNGEQTSVGETGDLDMTIKLTSAAFGEGGMIPLKYSKFGRDSSPPLAWSALPEGTRSVALVCDDPDAPVGTWVHWVLYDWPHDVLEVPERLSVEGELPNGAKQGRNDFGDLGYGGPQPPGGTHRYFFKIYALDRKLVLGPGVSAKELMLAMEGHVLAKGQLMGKYSK